MRLKLAAENWLERLALLFGWAPTPIFDTMQAMLLCRTIMAASRLGVFEAIGSERRSAEQIARAIAADPAAVSKLLAGLVSSKYVRCGGGRYWLTSAARKWFLSDSATSLHENMLFRYLEWDVLDHLEHFVKTGEPLDAHDLISDDRWEVYHRGLQAIARLSATEVARRMPLPVPVTSMLDVGGAHAEYAVAICRRFPQAQVTVLELPQAVESARHVFQTTHNGDFAPRITFRGGNALTEELGERVWSLIFIAQLAHHFTEEENRELVRRAAQALQPDGVLAIVDAVRPNDPSAPGQTGQLLDLFFAVTSKSGTWSEGEIQAWQRSAGLQTFPAMALRTTPGVSLLAARNPQRI